MSEVTSISSFLFFIFCFCFAFLYSRTLQSNKDCANPAKVFTKKNLDIKGKKGLQKPQKKRIEAFIESLKLRFVCNGYNVSYFLPFIDLEKNIWVSETDSVC